MPTFEKGGKKQYHMNPQMGRSLHSFNKSDDREEKAEEELHPGLHEEVAKKLEKYNGHDHEGHQLAHHVEIHHGGNEKGEPPKSESHTHHTITHPHPDHGSEPSIHNHESGQEAMSHASGAMHEGCSECEGGESSEEGESNESYE